MTSSDPTFRFSIDRGGTFADIYCDIVHSNKIISRKVLKLLSEDPLNYNDAPTEGIRRVMEQELKVSLPRNNPIPTKQIEYIRMGTTVATNALLERKGERVAFITTKGFADIQFIGNQSRPKIFDLEIKRPDLLYEHVAELNERVIFHKESVSELKSSPISKAKENSRIVTTLSNEKLIIESPINEEEVLIELHKIKSLGINSLAVCLLHSYIFPDHEKIVQRLAQQVGFSQISLSSDVMPMIRMVPRGCTTCVDAYLTPVIKRYLDSFVKGFDEHLQKDNKVSFMQSDGGLTSMQSFFGNRAILSGPAGGVVGFAMTFTDYRRGKHASSTLGQSNSKSHSSPINSDSDAVIGFDMGGTSTDVSRYAGEYEHVFESITAGITIQSPQLDINTVAAGGGSRLFFKNGLFTVGPESAGAHPGPVCYRKGGPLTVTDANVLLGRVQPHLFPSIFGHSEKEMLDAEATRAAFESLTIEINEQSRSKSIQYTVEEVASGFIRVANEAMARPIRNLTTMKGRDVTKHSLATFGGAGPQHCCAIAKSLGIKQIFISKYSGVLSAYGLSLADVVIDRQEPADGSDIIQSMPSMLPRLAILNQSARSELAAQGFHDVNMNSVFYLNCRYQGTDTSMMIPFPSNVSPETLTATQFQQLFIDTYKREYGFELVGRAVLLDDVRVRVVGNASQTQSNSQSQVKSVVPADKVIASASKGDKDTVKPQEYASVYFDDLGRHRTPVYRLISLVAGDQILGPAIIIQDITTIVIEPECRAALTPNGDIEVEVLSSGNKVLSTAMDPIYLSIFSHRFMGIAEQMGRTLQRTSISVNIKERLDFSCALFDPQGGLVANAPHLPVHLGAMSEAGNIISIECLTITHK